jgi:hypothetical protein
MSELFSGDYGEAFLERQRRIGEVHVRVGIPPLFVAASMSFLRSAFPAEIEASAQAMGEPADVYTGAVLRLLDLCQYLIDSSYEEKFLEAAGISPELMWQMARTAF